LLSFHHMPRNCLRRHINLDRESLLLAPLLFSTLTEVAELTVDAVLAARGMCKRTWLATTRPVADRTHSRQRRGAQLRVQQHIAETQNLLHGRTWTRWGQQLLRFRGRLAVIGIKRR